MEKLEQNMAKIIHVNYGGQCNNNKTNEKDNTHNHKQSNGPTVKNKGENFLIKHHRFYDVIFHEYESPDSVHKTSIP